MRTFLFIVSTYILTTATAVAEITMKNDISPVYIEKHPISITLQLRNNDSNPVTIPDISEETWRVSFTLVYPNGQKRSVQSNKKEEQHNISLAAQQLQEATFVIPQSETLSTGVYTCSIVVDLGENHAPITIEKQIHIQKQHIQYSDIDAVRDDIFTHKDDILWTQQTETDSWVFRNTNAPVYIRSIPKNVPIFESIHIDNNGYMYWIENNTIHLQHHKGQRLNPQVQNISLPWKNVIFLARGVTNNTGVFYIPIWVTPQTGEKGTVYVLILDENAPPKYRKIASMNQPKHVDFSITHNNTPLLLVQHNAHTDLFALQEVGDTRIDTLPPPSHRLDTMIAPITPVQTSFGVHTEHGLVAYNVYEDTKTQAFILRCYSIQGKQIFEQIIEFPKNTNTENSTIPVTFTTSVLKGTEIEIIATSQQNSKTNQFIYTHNVWKSVPTNLDIHPHSNSTTNTVYTVHPKNGIEIIQIP